jgi:dTDP-4-amino-4,6-dideoxygalactose transaminase
VRPPWHWQGSVAAMTMAAAAAAAAAAAVVALPVHQDLSEKELTKIVNAVVESLEINVPVIEKTNIYPSTP